MTSPADRPASYREVFAVAEFRALFGAQLLSTLGDQLARVALAVLVFQRTSSPGLTTLTYALTYLPDLLAGPLLSGLGRSLPPARGHGAHRPRPRRPGGPDGRPRHPVRAAVRAAGAGPAAERAVLRGPGGNPARSVERRPVTSWDRGSPMWPTSSLSSPASPSGGPWSPWSGRALRSCWTRRPSWCRRHSSPSECASGRYRWPARNGRHGTSAVPGHRNPARRSGGGIMGIRSGDLAGRCAGCARRRGCRGSLATSRPPAYPGATTLSDRFSVPQPLSRPTRSRVRPNPCPIGPNRLRGRYRYRGRPDRYHGRSNRCRTQHNRHTAGSNRYHDLPARCPECSARPTSR
jgi:hypothetical protein